jgi:hypothetical protein
MLFVHGGLSLPFPLTTCILSRALVPGPLSLGLRDLSFGEAERDTQSISRFNQALAVRKLARTLNQEISACTRSELRTISMIY